MRLRDPNTWRWFARDNDDDQVVAENEPAGGKKPLSTPPAAAGVFRGKSGLSRPRRPAQATPASTGKAADSRQGRPARPAPRHPLPCLLPSRRVAGGTPPKDSSTAACGIDPHGPDRSRSDRAGGNQAGHFVDQRWQPGNDQIRNAGLFPDSELGRPPVHASSCESGRKRTCSIATSAKRPIRCACKSSS